MQAGTFGDVRNAQALVNRLQGLDPQLPATTLTSTTPEGKSLSRVVVGRFATPAEARALCVRLARAGVAGLVRQGENL